MNTLDIKGIQDNLHCDDGFQCLNHVVALAVTAICALILIVASLIEWQHMEEGIGMNKQQAGMNYMLAFPISIANGVSSVNTRNEVAFVHNEMTYCTVNVTYISWNFSFDNGDDHVIGRGFNKSDLDPHAERVVIVCERLWRDMFGAEPISTGKVLFVGGLPRIIIGIIPETSTGKNETLYIPCIAYNTCVRVCAAV